MADTGGVVLLVESDPDLRERMGGWLEDEGLVVLQCPGPSEPDYTCVATRGGPCPIADVADAVVLDLWLGGDRALMGSSSTQLLGHYLAAGKPVLALSARHDHTRLFRIFADSEFVLMEWPPERRDLCETVRSLLKARSEASRGVRSAEGP